jgi:hypothetical protein
MSVLQSSTTLLAGTLHIRGEQGRGAAGVATGYGNGPTPTNEARGFEVETPTFNFPLGLPASDPASFGGEREGANGVIGTPFGGQHVAVQRSGVANASPSQIIEIESQLQAATFQNVVAQSKISQLEDELTTLRLLTTSPTFDGEAPPSSIADGSTTWTSTAATLATSSARATSRSLTTSAVVTAAAEIESNHAAEAQAPYVFGSGDGAPFVFGDTAPAAPHTSPSDAAAGTGGFVFNFSGDDTSEGFGSISVSAGAIEFATRTFDFSTLFESPPTSPQFEAEDGADPE